MGFLSRPVAGLIAASFFFCAMAARACELPAGTPLWVRLSAPVSSYFSKAGSEIHAVVTEELLCQDGLAIPAGTAIDGHVRSVKKVGWGLRHETAALGLEFDRVNRSDATSFAVEARVLEVENSRETVRNGVIIGIRSTDTPQGTINSRLKHLPSWNPYTDAVLLVYKATFPIFPEPEIWYGAGTDLRLELVKPLEIASIASPQPMPPAPPGQLEVVMAQFPQRVFTADEKDADVVNIALLGTQAQLEMAFRAAGWVGSDKLSKASFFREFHAFLDHSGYATAPMRPMLLDNAPPDMLWQKSLNTYSKRDHLRIWNSSQTVNGTTIWIGAATHDDGATLSLRNKRFVHNIDPQIDKERAKIVRDLKVAGCVQSVLMIDRPGMPNYMVNATGDLVKTDNKIAAVELKDCRPPEVPKTNTSKFKPGNVVFRYLRRQILTVRSDIWRANIIYGAYDLARLLKHAAHSLEKPAIIPDEASAGVNASTTDPHTKPATGETASD